MRSGGMILGDFILLAPKSVFFYENPWFFPGNCLFGLKSPVVLKKFKKFMQKMGVFHF